MNEQQTTHFEVLSSKLDNLTLSINEFKVEIKSKNVDLEVRLKVLEKRETELTTEIRTISAITKWFFGGGLLGAIGVVSYLINLKK